MNSSISIQPKKEKKENRSVLPVRGSVPVRIRMKTLLADTCTPVSLYLRLRDRFPGAVLLESADNAEGKNSRSFIALQPVAELKETNGCLKIEIPSCAVSAELNAANELAEQLNAFFRIFKTEGDVPPEAVTGLVGYTAYDAVRFFEDIELKKRKEATIPAVRYALYRTMIVFDPLRHSLHIVEQLLPGDESDTKLIEAAVAHRDVPAFRFSAAKEEKVSVTAEEFLSMAERGIAHCRRGDVFQLVLSRRFSRRFSGDEFNVYRALRAINPSPYLFFADYGDYRIFGSSPEAQLVVQDQRAIVHPIAGTFRRTGDAITDSAIEKELLADPKENAEHIMLVDLARNDLARSASGVKVEALREVHRYSHVIHLVSKVSAALKKETNLFAVLANMFPAGTLSGAPKIRAMQLIDALEPVARGFYGGCIGLAGFDGTMNQAIMIRSFLSKNGELVYQAGAGIVVSSLPANELNEIDNKLAALRKAIAMAEQIHN